MELPARQRTRRDFLGTAAAAGAALALAPHLDAARNQKKELRTLFFNFSHEDHEGHTYYLVMGKERHLLQPAGPDHPALLSASQTNRLLQSISAGSITHVLENVAAPANQVLLTYAIKDPDTTTGEWAMSSMYVLTPKSSTRYAYAQASTGLLQGSPLPLSAKRMKYGLPAAVTLQDVLDEQDVVDSTDWAKAMVNVHPEMLSADPKSASHIQNNLIDARSTFQLSQKLEFAGPALPQQSATADNSNNATGWATLVPFTDDDGVTPLKNTTGNNKGLILYNAQWQPSVNTFVAAAMKPTSSAVKNDPSLGVDVTPGRANLTGSDLTGTIWCRRDGIPNIDQSGEALNALKDPDTVNYALNTISPTDAGYSLSAATSVAGDTVNVKLHFTNWYVRYLGLYAQFLDGSGKPLSLSLPAIKAVSQAAGLDQGDTFVYLGLITPEFTILGIPVASSSTAVSFEFPTSVAASAQLLASGAGEGSHTFEITEPLGTWLTFVFNIAIPTLFLAIGVCTQLDVFIKTVVLPAINTFAIEFIELFTGTPNQALTIFIRSLYKWLANPGGPLKVFITQLAAFLAEAEVTTAVQDAIPIVGAILQAIGAIGVGVELGETAYAVAVSPYTYKHDLVGTHDLYVTLKPDSKDKGGFPASAATYLVTAIFDNGTPVPQTLNMPGKGVQTLPPVAFKKVPLGGKVTVSAAFYTGDGTLVGHGDVSVPNDMNASPAITITEVQLPITSATVYMHKQKTVLDAQGNHVWACAPAPAAPAAASFCEESPGNLCEFRNITVSSLGYLGYGWQSYNNAGCTSGGAGQLDQMANLFVTNDSNGNAQTGYAATPCALQPGTKLVYDPLGRPGANYYLDSTNGNNLVRQVQLAPPAFADPRANNAWGKFNLNPTDLLLHPAGALVSINSDNSRMESLRLPAGPVSDADASATLLATFHGGLGSRPGLFNAPTVTTITSDGVILILESGNNRIHAVDLAANPVQHFTKQPTPYFLNFSETGGSDTSTWILRWSSADSSMCCPTTTPCTGWIFIIRTRAEPRRFPLRWALMPRR